METDAPLETNYCYIAMDATYVTIWTQILILFVKSTLSTFCPSVFYPFIALCLTT